MSHKIFVFFFGINHSKYLFITKPTLFLTSNNKMYAQILLKKHIFESLLLKKNFAISVQNLPDPYRTHCICQRSPQLALVLFLGKSSQTQHLVHTKETRFSNSLSKIFQFLLAGLFEYLFMFWLHRHQNNPPKGTRKIYWAIGKS